MIVSLIAAAALSTQPPNVVLILCDNLGNGDVACFNPHTKHRTPHLDRMAAEGRRFTSFYSASGVCSPSRAALMTGCYPRRVGMDTCWQGSAVLRPVDKKGLHAEEDTLAELLKRVGYTTACFGKWHLGDQPEFLPTRQGFDTYLGIPYSEDMVRGKVPGRDWPELPLLEKDRVIEAPTQVEHLTKRLTEAAVQFIADHKANPFFIYFPVPGPGSRPDCYPSPAFKGKSANGLYGDAIEEIDWSAGQIIKALKDHDLDENTLIIWTSDNGAVRRIPQQGSNAPYQGWGYSTTEGGMRMPCIMRWPARIPPGTECRELTTMMDLLPTLTRLSHAASPRHPIDGRDITPLLFGEAPSPHDETGFFYYQIRQLQAVRAGPWKLYLPLQNKNGLGPKAKPQPQSLALYNVRDDLAETTELSAKEPTIVKKLLTLADKARLTLGDNDQPGTQQRPSGWVENPTPLLLAQ